MVRAVLPPESETELSGEEKVSKLELPKQKSGGFFVKIANVAVLLIVIAGAASFFMKDDSAKPSALQERIDAAQKAIAPDPDALPQDTPAPLNDSEEAKSLRRDVAELLARLDSFKDSATFKQCIYGCGKDNPGKSWDIDRKALQDRVTPQTDAPLLLKAAPSDLWSLGMAYGKGKTEEAAELRAQIEEALRE